MATIETMTTAFYKVYGFTPRVEDIRITGKHTAEICGADYFLNRKKELVMILDCDR